MEIKQKSNNQLIRLSIISILLVIVALIPREIVFDETKIICIHYYVFGFQCPLCGMTRAVYEFTHFHFSSAVNNNPVVALLPLYFALDITTVFFHQKWMKTAKKLVIISILTGFLMLYLFRLTLHFFGG